MRTNVLLALALVVLAVFARIHALRGPHFSDDAGAETERVAAALAAGRGWSDAFREGTGPTAHTAPVYPLLLAGVYSLCGNYETPTGRLAQKCLAIALSVLALLFLPVLARKLGLSAAAGWGAAIAKALFVTKMEIHGGYENVLATLALLGLIWCFADLRQRGWSGRWPLARTGVLLGLTALLYPNGLLVTALFFLVELVRGPNERAKIIRSGVILAAICVCLTAPWMVRNYRVLGGFVPLRSNFGLELAIGNRPGADGYTYAPGGTDLHPYSRRSERVVLQRLGELAYMRAKQRQALTWIAENPRQFTWLTLRRIWQFYLLKTERWITIHTPIYPLSIPLVSMLTLTVAVELLRLLSRNPPTARLLACALLGVGLPYFVTHVEPRYRTPLHGLFLLLGCNFIVALVLWARGKLAPSRSSGPGITAERKIQSAMFKRISTRKLTWMSPHRGPAESSPSDSRSFF